MRMSAVGGEMGRVSSGNFKPLIIVHPAQ